MQLAKDQQVVVYHGPTLERLTKSKKKVVNCTLEELQQLELVSKEFPEIRPQRIPSFEEYLEWVQEKIDYARSINIELNPWGLDEVEDLFKINQLNVRSIITDFPDRLAVVQKIEKFS